MSGGVARTSLCQKGVNTTTESISDRTSCALRCTPSLSLNDANQRHVAKVCTTPLWNCSCLIVPRPTGHTYKATRSSNQGGRYVHKHRFPRSCFSVGLGPHAREHITGFRPSAAHAL